MVLGELGVIAVFAAIVIVPILIYTFLVFPNVDGVIQDIKWYNYDSHSQHYLFWTGFWVIFILGGIGGIRFTK